MSNFTDKEKEYMIEKLLGYTVDVEEIVMSTLEVVSKGKGAIIFWKNMGFIDDKFPFIDDKPQLSKFFMNSLLQELAILLFCSLNLSSPSLTLTAQYSPIKTAKKDKNNCKYLYSVLTEISARGIPRRKSGLSLFPKRVLDSNKLVCSANVLHQT